MIAIFQAYLTYDATEMLKILYKLHENSVTFFQDLKT